MRSRSVSLDDPPLVIAAIDNNGVDHITEQEDHSDQNATQIAAKYGQKSDYLVASNPAYNFLSHFSGVVKQVYPKGTSDEKEIVDVFVNQPFTPALDLMAETEFADTPIQRYSRTTRP